MGWEQILTYLAPAVIGYVLASWRGLGDSSADLKARVAVLFEKTEKNSADITDNKRDIKALWHVQDSKSKRNSDGDGN